VLRSRLLIAIITAICSVGAGALVATSGSTSSGGAPATTVPVSGMNHVDAANGASAGLTVPTEGATPTPSGAGEEAPATPPMKMVARGRTEDGDAYRVSVGESAVDGTCIEIRTVGAAGGGGCGFASTKDALSIGRVLIEDDEVIFAVLDTAPSEVDHVTATLADGVSVALSMEALSPSKVLAFGSQAVVPQDRVIDGDAQASDVHQPITVTAYGPEGRRLTMTETG
jgi:hypothetical protein